MIKWLKKLLVGEDFEEIDEPFIVESLIHSNFDVQTDMVLWRVQAVIETLLTRSRTIRRKKDTLTLLESTNTETQRIYIEGQVAGMLVREHWVDADKLGVPVIKAQGAELIDDNFTYDLTKAPRIRMVIDKVEPEEVVKDMFVSAARSFDSKVLERVKL